MSTGRVVLKLEISNGRWVLIADRPKPGELVIGLLVAQHRPSSLNMAWYERVLNIHICHIYICWHLGEGRGEMK